MFRLAALFECRRPASRSPSVDTGFVRTNLVWTVDAPLRGGRPVYTVQRGQSLRLSTPVYTVYTRNGWVAGRTGYKVESPCVLCSERKAGVSPPRFWSGGRVGPRLQESSVSAGRAVNISASVLPVL
jgi:hypothetical protein